MNYQELKKRMVLFSLEDLKTFLGSDLVEQLALEWSTNESRITKGFLSDVLLQVYGAAILQNQAFRKTLLMHLTLDEIDGIFTLLPATKRANKDTPLKKIDAIVSMSWVETDANLKLLSIIGLDKKVFEKKTEDDTVLFQHCAYDQFYELLDYQYVIEQRVFSILKKEQPLKRVLIHMPTGTGKTKTSMHTIINFYTKELHKKGAVIWLAHTTELLNQAYDTFTNVWRHIGIEDVKAYKVWGARTLEDIENVDSLQGFVFCGIAKMISIKKNQPQLFDKINNAACLIVFDEAHKAAATETRDLVESLMIKKGDMPDRSLIGLTATPGRTTLTSDENKLLANMFEHRIVSIEYDKVRMMNTSEVEFLNMKKDPNAMHFFQREKVLARIRKEELAYSEQFTNEELKAIRIAASNNGYVDFSSKSLELIGKNRSRNQAIIRRLRELATEKIPTIVFACSVNHAKLLSCMLTLDDIPNGLVLGDMNPADRAETISRFKNRGDSLNILINYEVLTTGFDATNIRCVFITRPTQSIVLYSQMLGRGLRGPMMGGNEECLLIDLKDNLGKYNEELAFHHFDAYWN